MISKSKNSDGKNQDTRLGDCRYFCLRFRKLEFFCLAEKFVEHSNYFNRLYNYILTDFEAQKFKGLV